MNKSARWVLALVLILALFVVLPAVIERMHPIETFIILIGGVFSWFFAYFLVARVVKDKKQWYLRECKIVCALVL